MYLKNTYKYNGLTLSL